MQIGMGMGLTSARRSAGGASDVYLGKYSLSPNDWASPTPGFHTDGVRTPAPGQATATFTAPILWTPDGGEAILTPGLLDGVSVPSNTPFVVKFGVKHFEAGAGVDLRTEWVGGDETWFTNNIQTPGALITTDGFDASSSFSTVLSWALDGDGWAVGVIRYHTFPGDLVAVRINISGSNAPATKSGYLGGLQVTLGADDQPWLATGA